MNLAHLAVGDALFVDANILTYHFEPHARWGLACTQLLQRIEKKPAVHGAVHPFRRADRAPGRCQVR
jgi:hypothetical protein